MQEANPLLMVLHFWPWLLAFAVILVVDAIGRASKRAALIDWGHGWMNRLDGFNRLFCRYYHRLNHEMIELPETGPAILASNHISGLDPVLMFAASRRKLRFLIATEQYHRFGFEWLFRAVGCIPVDRTGRPEKAFREALKALKAGDVVALFPHGGIHLDSDPPRHLKAGAVRLAQLAGCPIYPVRLEGVRAQGGIFMPVLLRARARITNRSKLECAELAPRECLNHLEELLKP